MEIQLSDKVIEIKQKGKISEIFKNEIEKSKYEVIAAKFNNEYVNLDYEIKESGKLELIDISTKAKREEKIEKLERRIRKKANKKLFGTTGVKIPVSKARDELYYELKNIWYQKAI